MMTHHWFLCIKKYGFKDHIEDFTISPFIFSPGNMPIVGKQIITELI